MFMLNSNGDTTIKCLNLDLFYETDTLFLWYEFIQIQNFISQLIFEILKNSFQLSASLE